MSRDVERLHRRKARPALVELHRRLSGLRTSVTVLYVGAEPGDEPSGLLAYLRYGLGMRVVLALFAGETGSEIHRQAEDAARVLDADIAWLSGGADEQGNVEQLASLYRRERPDIVLAHPDTPAAAAAEAAIERAGESLAEAEAEGTKPWKTSKLYLLAEGEDPEPTLTLTAPLRDVPTGASFGEIGEWSRSCYAGKDLGHWQAEPRREWKLHLRRGSTGETGITTDLPINLGDLAEGLAEAAGKALPVAQRRINDAVNAFPDRNRIITNLAEAAKQLEIVQAALMPWEADRLGHRITRKLGDVDAALVAASAIHVTAWVEPETLYPGAEGMLMIHLEIGDAKEPISVTPVISEWMELGEASVDGSMLRYGLRIAADAPTDDAQPETFLSLGGNGALHVEIETLIRRRLARASFDLENPLSIRLPG